MSSIYSDFQPMASITEQQRHTAGVHVEIADSFIVLHNRVLSALRHLYSCDFRYTFFLLVRFWTHSGWERALRHCGTLRRFYLSCKSSYPHFTAVLLLDIPKSLGTAH